MAANEATCLGLADACGLTVPEMELLDLAGLPVLAVRRYDRRDSPAGRFPARLHQEDGCQATARPPGMKYEEQGGPSLRDLAGQPMRADTHLSQRVGGQADIGKVTAASLIDEATTWGIRRRAASAVVAETLDRVLAAIPATPGDDRVLSVVREQSERIRLRP